MGLENEAVLSYLEDNGRFADLFNQLYFKGKQVVEAGDLLDASEVYHGKPGEKSGQRTRDIKKRLKSGKELKILALESQNEVNYIMPWRVMDYDCREYGKQIREAQRINNERAKAGESIYESAGERLSKVRKAERFAPVYTLCLYHGMDPWDGPRSLKDMMEFGDEQTGNGDAKEWVEGFADYPLRLVSVGEPMDCSGFRTSLRNLFSILPYRKDKKQLKELLNTDPAYQEMDEETARTISVLMGIKKFREKEENYRTEEGKYNMCQAIQEMMEDSRLEGISEGELRGEARGIIRGETQGSARQIIEIIDNIMRELHCSLEKACKVGGKTLDQYHQAKAVFRKVSNRGGEV